jgi:hypothetical protein
MFSLTDLAKGTAYFQFYRDGSLYYKIHDFTFAVPINDVGTATLLPQEKGILLMRWLRPAVAAANQEKT